MEFILDQQAQFAAKIGQLEENLARQSENLSRLTGIVERVVDTVDRLAQVTVERFEETDRKLDALVDAQIQTEGSLRSLSDTLNRHIVEGHRDKKDEPGG